MCLSISEVRDVLDMIEAKRQRVKPNETPYVSSFQIPSTPSLIHHATGCTRKPSITLHSSPDSRVKKSTNPSESQLTPPGSSPCITDRMGDAEYSIRLVISKISRRCKSSISVRSNLRRRKR